MRRLREMIQRLDMVGSIFVYLDCRGCMAHDHQVVWIGTGRRFTNGKALGWHEHGSIIEIEIVKRHGESGDIRDKEFKKEVEHFFVADNSIQNIAPRLYLIFK